MFFNRTPIQLKALPDFSAFQFISKGIAGSTTREVSFRSQQEPGVYSLDLNDLPITGQSSPTIADNGDMNKVMNTLILIIELYTQRFPDRTIRLKGDTQEKARLYRVAIDMYVNKLVQVFDIGLEEEEQEKEEAYQGFRLRSRRQRGIDNIAITLKRKAGFCFIIHSIQTTLNSRSLLLGSAVSVEVHRDIETVIVTVDSNSQT
ncbi:MAG: hypothetical protein JST68_10080 [Bacteroidetes bacterium]|nr:hypothetical protein [Bacteroidota bacterium]